MAIRSIGLLVLICLADFAGTARAQLVENGLYDVAGVWSGGVLRATAIEPAEDDVKAGDIEVEGRITALDLKKRVLQIGPVTVQWSESTRFIAIKPEALKVAAWIELEGRMVGPRRLLATVIERAPAAGELNYLRIVGAVRSIEENADGSVRFEMIGVPVLLPGDVYRGLKSSSRDTEEEEDEETSGTSLKVSGEYELKLDYRKDFALEKQAKDDLFRLDQEFQLRLFYPHNDWVSLFVEGKVFGEHQVYTERSGRRSDVELERGETWVRFDKLFGRNLTLKVGRQNFEEPRRWWWDDELDAVGVRYRQNPWFFELGIAREVLPESLLESFIDPENERVLRVLARADWRYSKNHRLGLFFLHQYDSSRSKSPGALVRVEREDESDAKLWWVGLRAMGNAPGAGYGDLSYWADAATVVGSETLLELADEAHRLKRVLSRKHQRVRGWALDVGGRWASQLPGRPIFIMGYAFGSGDKNPERGSDRAFRQTGLQSNDEEFRTYGELLRPELSNLSIPTLAVQFPLFSESHIEFAYRHFRQHHALPFLRDARIEADPNGVSKSIGQEWMIYSAVKEWDRVEIEWVGAAFRAGRAYGALSGKMAYSLFTKVTFSF
ncbi:MAG: alginate export family protein [Candidatus Binatia bacterium]